MGTTVTWGSILLGVITGLSTLIAWLREKDMVKAGEATAIVESLRKQADDLEKANRAREDARLRNAAVPSTDSLPDDGFLRK